MPVSKPESEAVLAGTVAAWVADPDNDVVYSERVDGHLVIRMRQTVREFTSVWFLVGDRSIKIEAHVLPAPPEEPRPSFVNAWFAIGTPGECTSWSAATGDWYCMDASPTRLFQPKNWDSCWQRFTTRWKWRFDR